MSSCVDGTRSSSPKQVKEKPRASGNVVAHLFWHDVKRNLRPIRALPVLAISICLAYRQVGRHYEIGDTQDFLYFAEGALSRNHHWLQGPVPLFAGAMGAALAAERRSGVTLGILAKGAQRRQYVVAKMLGAAASSALLTSAAILVFFVIVFTAWIPGRAPPVETAWLPAPVQALFAYSPFAHDLLVAAMLITAAAALSLVGVLAGLIIANEYIAMAAVPIFAIVASIVFDELNELLSPQGYLDLGYSNSWSPQFHWLIPFAPFLYWGVFSAIIVFLCQRIIAKKELA